MIRNRILDWNWPDETYLDYATVIYYVGYIQYWQLIEEIWIHIVRRHDSI